MVPVLSRSCSALVSSGRHIPTSEQRGHLGLSCSGGGIVLSPIMAFMSCMAWRVFATLMLLSGTSTRFLDAA